MLLDSFEHAEEDVKARLLAEQRVEADAHPRGRARRAWRDAPELLDDERARGDRAGAGARVEAARAGSDHLRDPRRGRGARPRVEAVREAAHEPRARAGLRGQSPSTTSMTRLAATPKSTARRADVDRAEGQVRTGRDRDRGAGRGPASSRRPRRRHAQVGSACGGVCACSTCHVYVKEGLDDLVGRVRARGGHPGQGVRRAGRLAPRLPGEDRRRGRDIVVEISRESRQAFLDEHPRSARR